MNTYPAEPHLPEPPEDTCCSACDGSGEGVADTVCKACDGTGAGYQQWLKAEHGKAGGSER